MQSAKCLGNPECEIHHQSNHIIFPLMSRNARSNENGRFDKISSNWVNAHGFDNFGEFQSNLSNWNQLGGINDFGNFNYHSIASLVISSNLLIHVTYLTSVPHDLFNFSSMVFGRAHRSLATRVTSLLMQSAKLMHPIGG